MLYSCDRNVFTAHSNKMAKPDNFSLFFSRNSPFFPDGTLFELENKEVLRLPDRGDGVAAEIDRSQVMACPPFAENVPPGQCPVLITSLFPRAGEAVLDQTIHYQIVAVPLPSSGLASVVVDDRLRGFEADCYEFPTLEPENIYRLHISHLRPGFYETEFSFANGGPVKMTFIKLFPQQFTDRYGDLLAAEISKHPKPPAAKPVERAPAFESHLTGGPFSDELLNTALELTTEWGENFYKPINERILARYPNLTADEIGQLTKLSREAESFIYSLGERELAGEIGETDIPVLAREQITWINDTNLYRLINIGMYYARR